MQSPKDIVVYIDNADREAFRPRIEYAAALAHRWGAHLVVAFAPEDLSLNLHAGFTRGAATISMLTAFERRRVETEELARRLLQAAGAKFDVSWEFRLCEGEHGEALMLHARHSAIAVLGSSREPERQVTALTMSEDVIFASGRPSILLPVGWSGETLPRKIVIGWNASREATRAVSDAMPFLRMAEQVHVVVVPEPKIARLLGEDPGSDISRHLARYDIPVVLDRLDGANAADLLLSKVKQIEADMLVVGAYGQPKITEFVFGSVTQTLLTAPGVPVLLSR
ncbi:universal stress protein (plasmid) [Agrobacterium radiobacter]|uniref:Putative universal stress protein n=1 Tax=Agrobacterium tumefaciens str. B6 TaxID=1183423 RepID=A0A822VBP1_AGRTU|nr:universal stress protein [Agrobacterium tumefaciens]MQB27845.1 universal stress protein [Agrobacterium tumefaciens]NTA08381.1 universal stress protein [Agrobacterium tumefaciens]NTB16203.1 universal stress protein [Agrobacterium tumefaciens]CVI25238.1 putative universal stress protein [Agrobacterium tumefaciens str. B6]